MSKRHNRKRENVFLKFLLYSCSSNCKMWLFVQLERVYPLGRQRQQYKPERGPNFFILNLKLVQKNGFGFSYTSYT